MDEQTIHVGDGIVRPVAYCCDGWETSIVVSHMTAGQPLVAGMHQPQRPEL